MSIEISTFNNYGYAIDQSALKDNIKLVLNNAQNKSATPEQIVENKLGSTNSALLFEYTQGIAKTNVAQQLVLDANLKETLKFLKSEAAKKMLNIKKKKFGTIIEHILTENDVNGYSSKNHTNEDEINELIDLFDIKIDAEKKNIFAA